LSWSDRAEADLDEIWRFTEERWGEDQADLYLCRLKQAVADATVRKRRARAINFVRPGLFKMREVRHFIYFRIAEGEIVVVRVLHDSMDEILHLP